ncbi:MAG: hypothetical protein J6Y94_00595, partial [Bacteriovoracaceae bacterium]|nr:hypothetical protein [Bacteriovoracaceae bacterium]
MRQNYEQKEFHENAEVDAFIKACLKRYFALAAQKNHTFLFGHHEYVYPLIAQDGHLQYSAGDPAAALGIGSGAIF